MKLLGRISYYSPQRHFGFIEHRGPGGWIERYFFFQQGIVRSETDDIHEGLPVLFDVSPTQPTEGRSPLAISIEIFLKVPPAPASGIDALSNEVRDA
jgi:hypothetical protein